MVWPFTSSTTTSSSSNNASPPPPTQTTDPYSKLDPSLRAFLERESPVKYHSPTPPPPSKPSAPDPAPLGPFNQHALPKNATPHDPANPSHGQTLFPDGRYNSLWTTYRPLRDIENETKTDQEKLMDVLSAYKERKRSIGKAALENCAAVHFTLDECFRNGNWRQRMNMCRHETQALDRCYSMNSRFLKALGYLSAMDRGGEEEERIQMHADKLYLGMLGEEEERKRAKREGREEEVPRGETLGGIQVGEGEGAGIGVGLGGGRPPELDMLNEKTKAKLAERTKGMSAVEKDVEERAFAAEIRAGLQMNEKLERHRSEVREERKQRIETGPFSLGDTVAHWLGW